MNRFTRVMMVASLVAVLTVPAVFAGTEKDAKDMVKKGAALFKSAGETAALKSIGTPGGEFVKNDTYLYCVGPDNKISAHPVNKGLMGVNFYNLKDVDNVAFGKQILDSSKAGKTVTVDYKWMNPAAKKIMTKRAYFQKMGSQVCISGAYRK